MDAVGDGAELLVPDQPPETVADERARARVVACLSSYGVLTGNVLVLLVTVVLLLVRLSALFSFGLVLWSALAVYLSYEAGAKQHEQRQRGSQNWNAKTFMWLYLASVVLFFVLVRGIFGG